MALQDKIYQYFERNINLHVLFIFDPMGVNGEELADVQWREGYRFVAPKTRWFNIKYLVDRDWKDDKVIMYFMQASPVETKQDFPLMDLLKANMEYHDQDYAAFMQLNKIPQQYASYISKHIAELQSDKMMSLLERHYADKSFNIDIANRAFLSLYLDKTPKQVADWTTIIIRLILFADEAEASKREAFFNRLDKNMDAKNALVATLEKIFKCGLQVNTEERVNLIVQKMKYNSIVQLLPVNPHDAYKQLRIEDAFAIQDINRIMETALSEPKTAEKFRNVMRAMAAEVRESEIVKTYGVDAEYWTLSPSMAWAIMQSIIDDKLATEPQEALDRLNYLQIKCSEPSVIKEVVDFARFTAQYYDTSKGIKSVKLNTPDEYVSRYCSEFYLLDYYYRSAVNRFYNVDNTVPIFATLERAKSDIDAHYHKLSNLINLEWIECLKEKGGFANVSLIRQQDFYEKYVKPMAVKVVVVISDALRYEVAKQLEERLSQLRHPTRFEAALAMLPTETCYCKTSLLPHQSLHFLEAQKMMVDGNLLIDTAARTKHLQTYRPKSECKTFDAISRNSRDENREICKNDVLYIFHDTIDENSHGNKSAKVITDSCERTVDELFKLVKSLHASWNATHVIITSDHGFLFNDIKFEEKDKQPVADEILERKSRYYITHSNQTESQIAKMPLKEVSGMDNEDLFVAVPLGTNRLYAPGGDYVFCHGGASLQEMIIPVIVSHRQDEEKRGAVGVAVLEQNLRMTSSRVKFTVLQTEAVSGENKERTIRCAIYDGDNMVSPQKELTLDRGDASLDARKYPVELTLNKPTSAGVLRLRIYDVNDLLNPQVDAIVTNNTLIERDF